MTRPRRAVRHTLRRLIEQAGGHADLERHVPELHDWVRNKDEAALVMRCARYFRRGLLVSGRPAATLDRRQRAMPACTRMQNDTTKVRRKVAGEAETTKRYGMAEGAFVFETCGRLGGEGAKLLRDSVTAAAASGQCSPHAVGRWRTQLERVLLTAQADTYL